MSYMPYFKEAINDFITNSPRKLNLNKDELSLLENIVKKAKRDITVGNYYGAKSDVKYEDIEKMLSLIEKEKLNQDDSILFIVNRGKDVNEMINSFGDLSQSPTLFNKVMVSKIEQGLYFNKGSKRKVVYFFPISMVNESLSFNKVVIVKEFFDVNDIGDQNRLKRAFELKERIERNKNIKVDD